MLKRIYNSKILYNLCYSLHIQKCESKVVDPCIENQNKALAPKATFHSAQNKEANYYHILTIFSCFIIHKFKLLEQLSIYLTSILYYAYYNITEHNSNYFEVKVSTS